MAGITVNRFAASDDTSHFSAEPSGVIVRGLPQVRSEFNGRDQFDANSSRGLSWGDVTPELMAGVDTYKNQTADLIEGGIAGSINLRTRDVPFDSPGTVYAATVDATYGDLRQKVSPDASALISKRWQTEYGEFGLLGDFAYSKVENESQGIQYTRMGGWTGFDGSTPGAPDYGTAGTVWIPSAVLDRDTLPDRTRIGYSITGQWQDNDHKFLVTGQFNRSEYTNIWQEHAIGSYPADVFYGLSADATQGPSNPERAAAWRRARPT